MNFEDFDINKFLQKNSSRHHYIPRFLIEGFKNTKGLLYVYDKKQDETLKRLKPPKSIFFGWNRNTVEVTQNKESSILEDLYSKMDNEVKSTVKHFQNEELNKIEFTPENTQYFKCFLITLLWRIPYSDFAAEELMNHSAIISSGIDPEILRSDPTYRKLQRPGIIPHTLKERMNSGKKWVNIHQWANDIAVIGDNPILFRKTPSSFSEFGDMDFLIAITSRRMYSSTKKKIENFKFFNFYCYNAAVINQSTRFTCCSNIEALQKSIQLYKEYKNRGIESMVAEDTFDTT